MPQPQRMQQTMPELEGDWRQVRAGPHLDVRFHPNRLLIGHEPDDVVRPTIVVAVTGRREQALRFDPFSVGGHYHIRPTQDDEPITLRVPDGQTPLDAALAFFEFPDQFRALLVDAGETEAAEQVTDVHLIAAAADIRKLNATRTAV